MSEEYNYFKINVSKRAKEWYGLDYYIYGLDYYINYLNLKKNFKYAQDLIFLVW